MKIKTLKYILGLSLLTILFMQCDKIEEPYLINPPEDITTNAIIEVFTGHLSMESPAAMEQLKQLKATYGNDLSVIVYHAGDDALPQDETYTVDLTTAFGTEIFTDFSGTSTQGMIGRTTVTEASEWDAAIQSQIDKVADLDISITEQFNIETRELSVSVGCEVINTIEDDIHIVSYITEDSIASAQKFENMDSLNYIHMQVFRASLDVTYGAFTIETPSNETYNHSYDVFNVLPLWRANQLKIVTIAYTGDATNPTILQVESKSVNTDPEPVKLRKVLIEEYTGVRCTNCPDAHAEIARLKAKYPGQVFSVAYHYSAAFATPYTGDQDFRTVQGSAIGDFFGVGSLPAGLVNRKEVVDFGIWESHIVESLAQEPEASIHIDHNYNEFDRNLSVDVDANFYVNIDESILISIHLVESGVVATQKHGTVLIEDYIHKDIFRTSMSNSIWGEVLIENPEVNQKYSKSFSTILNEDWVADNMSIVAVIYRESDKTVIQAEEIHVGGHK